VLVQLVQFMMAMAVRKKMMVQLLAMPVSSVRLRGCPSGPGILKKELSGPDYNGT